MIENFYLDIFVLLPERMGFEKIPYFYFLFFFTFFYAITFTFRQIPLEKIWTPFVLQTMG